MNTQKVCYTSLSLDNAGKVCSIALNHQGIFYESLIEAERRQAAYLLPCIDSLLKQTLISLKDLDFIAFGAGPGSFTGIRLTASVVQGLAFCANISVIPISTLQALAQVTYHKYKAKQVAVALNAYGGRLYWGAYKVYKGLMKPLVRDTLCLPNAIFLPRLDKVLPQEYFNNWVGVGNGWKVYPELFKNPISLTHIYEDIEYSLAKYVAYLAEPEYRLGRTFSADKALPIYLYGADCWKKQE